MIILKMILMGTCSVDNLALYSVHGLPGVNSEQLRLLKSLKGKHIETSKFIVILCEIFHWPSYVTL